MPAPIAIRDPATYYEYETQNDAPTSLEDPIVPLRNLLAPHKKSEGGASSVGGDSAAAASTSRATPTPTLLNDLDISLSPRLLGYVFSFISCVVSAISSIIFYYNETTVATPSKLEGYTNKLGLNLTIEQLEVARERIDDITQSYSLYFGSGGNLVQEWKVFGCIAISSLLAIITGAIVVAHFDSICCVRKNRTSFRDGSRFERRLILLLIVLSVFALYISTSKFSVGEAQANVFFSTWTNFVSCVVNYEVWRLGSGRHHTFQEVLFGGGGQQRHWFMLSIFCTISFFSTIDFYMENNIINDTNQLGCLDLRWTNQWVWLSFGGTVLSWGVVLLHRYRKPNLAVSVFEVIVILAMIGVCGYVVASFTGGRLDRVPCPSNLYFSVWITFFLSVWIFGSMIQKGRSLVAS